MHTSRYVGWYTAIRTMRLSPAKDGGYAYAQTISQTRFFNCEWPVEEKFGYLYVWLESLKQLDNLVVSYTLDLQTKYSMVHRSKSTLSHHTSKSMLSLMGGSITIHHRRMRENFQDSTQNCRHTGKSTFAYVRGVNRRR